MYGGTVIPTNIFSQGKPNEELFWKDGIHLSDKGTTALLTLFQDYVGILKYVGERVNRSGKMSFI